MNFSQKHVLFSVTLAGILGAALMLNYLRTHQKLGPPAVRTEAIATDPKRLHVVLPERVLDFSSVEKETEKIVLDFLPKDTSFGQREYTAADGFRTIINVVLMGTDRTSLHKPQFCLYGAGWDIDSKATVETTVPMTRPTKYDLPVMKLIATKRGIYEGREYTARGIFVYWFVAENALTSNHNQRMWWMASNLLRKGVLQRWAYVTCFSVCQPGQEDATYARMKQFMVAAVPEFQLTPSQVEKVAARP